jgi:hypothetical protein
MHCSRSRGRVSVCRQEYSDDFALVPRTWTKVFSFLCHISSFGLFLTISDRSPVASSPLHQAADVAVSHEAVCRIPQSLRGAEINLKVFDLEKPTPLQYIYVRDEFIEEARHMYAIGSLQTSTILPAKYTDLGQLWLVGRENAIRDNKDVVVVLATSGYADMLANFLCSVRKVFDHDVERKKLGVVVFNPVSDALISAVVAHFGIGLVSGTFGVDMRTCLSADDKRVTLDFGTLCYQKLILIRTTVVMHLMLLGFSPLIADIDTVWLQDALDVVHSSQFFVKSTLWGDTSGSDGAADIAVTIDGAEICGCFIYLSPSYHSMEFWALVLAHHESLVRNASKAGVEFKEFGESEQKILTALLLSGRHNVNLTVVTLDPDRFPSGLAYFTQRNHMNESGYSNNRFSNVAVVHNNFIVGNDIKRARFLWNGMWHVKELDNVNLAVDICSRDPLKKWASIFGSVDRDLNIPTVVTYSPIHNSKIHNSELLVIVSNEGLTHSSGPGYVAISSDPPEGLAYGDYMLNYLRTNGAPLHLSMSIVGDNATLRDTIDVIENRNDFSVDRGGLFHDIANRQAIEFYESSRNPFQQRRDFDLSGITIAVKVLAYNRPASLLRLLVSLDKAYYPESSQVDLEIKIDGRRAEVSVIKSCYDASRTYNCKLRTPIRRL